MDQELWLLTYHLSILWPSQWTIDES